MLIAHWNNIPSFMEQGAGWQPEHTPRLFPRGRVRLRPDVHLLMKTNEPHGGPAVAKPPGTKRKQSWIAFRNPSLREASRWLSGKNIWSTYLTPKIIIHIIFLAQERLQNITAIPMRLLVKRFPWYQGKGVPDSDQLVWYQRSTGFKSM